MSYLFELELDKHFRPSLWNVANTQEDNEKFRIILKRDLRRWLNTSAPGYAVVAARIEHSGPWFDDFGFQIPWWIWEIEIKAWIEFASKDHFMLFKLTWL